MPIIISYDLKTEDTNKRTYIRSALERFHWSRLGGSVFRYDGIEISAGRKEEDWFNHVIPALMFLRSYVLSNDIKIEKFTLDANSTMFIDFSKDEEGVESSLGKLPTKEISEDFWANPTNEQSSKDTLKSFIETCNSFFKK